ncbi:hypothetical protein [Burkholderia sp. Ac-20365]|uniref:hypothetical protein n=1 Tax=Burkholderia sp. Ac-20365 TaxID=2703897 RepID=UPI00197BE461|nr:hypothetical protein [Burkholderia sp. Ac-20365]MBN3760963.1 hypothetical protein [Burkholderia sp. Ac-20365]
MDIRKGVRRRILLYVFLSPIWAPLLAAALWRIVIFALHGVHSHHKPEDMRAVVLFFWALFAIALFVKVVFIKKPKTEPVRV